MSKKRITTTISDESYELLEYAKKGTGRTKSKLVDVAILEMFADIGDHHVCINIFDKGECELIVERASDYILELTKGKYNPASKVEAHVKLNYKSTGFFFHVIGSLLHNHQEITKEDIVEGKYYTFIDDHNTSNILTSIKMSIEYYGNDVPISKRFNKYLRIAADMINKASTVDLNSYKDIRRLKCKQCGSSINKIEHDEKSMHGICDKMHRHVIKEFNK